MASSSSSARSSQCPRWKYDVFLSFRGEDTRKTFTSHLYQGLKSRGILTFQDDTRLEHGASISEELLKAIEMSQVSLIIFSRNYASSSWCLDELVKIMKCKDEYGQTVIPIFYDVDPSTIRYQKEHFAKAFSKHESRYKCDVDGMKKVQRWRTALADAANLKGCDIRRGIESDCIQQIIDQVSSKLCKTSLPYLKNVVGIKTHLEKVKSLLEIQIDNIRIVGIWGMGGVGKTTIARAVFDTLSHQFEASCFLADVKEDKHGMHSLQNILLSELLREKGNYVNNKEDGKNVMARRLCSKKVLIVLDDIDHRDHLEYLAGDVRWFGNGSRIVITTRDRHLIEKDNAIYKVETLPNDEAMQLFSQHAFKKEVPDERFSMLSREVVYCHSKGLPLALKVWGSFLHNKNIREWRSAIEQMKKNSDSNIVHKLKISYDGLSPTQQQIFLDIACFLRGGKKDEIIQILNSCDFGADIGLRVLIDKSLVFVVDDRIEMHDLIQEMGKYIANMQKNSGECSRIWLEDDFKEMMHNMGTMAVETIWLPNCCISCLNRKAMKHMKRLRILNTRAPRDRWILDGFIECLPNNLRWLILDHYNWESLPVNFEQERLVHLELRCSSLRYIWTEQKNFSYLRRLDLRYSESLMRTPNFTGMPNLEYLNLEGCLSLEEVHDSLGNCCKLIRLNLDNCGRLKRSPCVNMESLEYLCLRHCSSLQEFPYIGGRVKRELVINMPFSGIRELPSSIQYLSHLTKLLASNCFNLKALPEEIGDLENLEELDASSTLISRPPPSIVRLNKLKFLSFAKNNLHYQKNGVYFVFPSVSDGLRSLIRLDLSYCNLVDGGLPKDLGCLYSLKDLNLSGNNFEHLPRSIGQLGALRSLDLSYCEKLKELPDFTGMPNLKNLSLSNCMNLEEVHRSLGSLKELTELFLLGCESLKRFPAVCIDSLKLLQLMLCSNLESFPEICGSMKVEIQMLESVIRDLHSIYNSFPRSLYQSISATHGLPQRVFTILHFGEKIPSWFLHQGRGTSVSVTVNLPDNWYECDNFLGVAVCYSGYLAVTKAQWIPLCDDGISWMTQKLALRDYSQMGAINLFFLPFAGLWDTFNANGKTPNNFGLLRLSLSGKLKEFGFRLLYKDEPEPNEALLGMMENNGESTECSNDDHDSEA